MQTQKVFMPNGKTLVICDYREREVAEHLEELGAKVNKSNLEVGDFICSDQTAVERKSHSDFVSSIIDGRLFDQAKLLGENFKRPIIIIEGYSDRDIDPNAFHAAVATLMKNYCVSLLWTKNIRETARALFWIAKKEQGSAGIRYDIGMKVGKKPKEMKKLQESLLASLPGVSSTISRRLLEKFGSVEAVMKADEAELRKVKGIGDGLAKRIRDIVTKRYA
jgi:Fanconi anemia group M protein